MKREPSIHVSRSVLVSILKEVLPEGVLVLGLTNLIIKKAKPYSLNSRLIISSTERLEEKSKRALSSSTMDANLMARTIVLVRKQLKHKGIVQIQATDREWAQVKAIANLANQFCIDFELPKRQGYIEYIKIAFEKMNRPLIQKIPSLHQGICDTYQAIKTIREDIEPEITESIHNYYRMKVAGKTGFVNNLKKTPEKYVYFVKVRELLKGLRVPMTHFINAQFEAMEWRGGLPEPAQLIGTKAKERLNKYLFEHKITVKD